MSNPSSPAPPTAAESPFAKFGPVETRPISRIQQAAGDLLARSWAKIPHVTHHDEIDVTNLEALRRRLATENPSEKLTPLAFFIKAVAKVLQEFPNFNASIDESGKVLIIKRYVHIGVAVDTPNGLLVPVIRDCDQKSLIEIAHAVADLSSRAREKGLPLSEMSGGCFSISSLGTLGGVGFTPIINSPEAAILGISRLVERPRRASASDGLDWRLMAPLSLSYDHRVINGAQAGRFMNRMAEILAVPERLL